MQDALQSFLVELAIDPGKLATYAQDRESYLERTNLSPEARQAILDGDEQRILELAGSGTTANTMTKKAKRRIIKLIEKKKKKKKKKQKKAKRKVAKKARRKSKRK